jgi:hypothetical protein
MRGVICTRTSMKSIELANRPTRTAVLIRYVAYHFVLVWSSRGSVTCRREPR